MAKTDKLFDMLQARTTPEDVARELVSILTLDSSELSILNKAASSRRYRWAMNDDFIRPQTGINKQLDLVPVLFGVAKPQPPIAQDVADLRASFGLPAEGQCGRMTKRQRRAAGIYKNARWFNKRRRLLNTLERKSKAYDANEELYLFTRVSKAGLSVEIPREEFDADLNTAALVTYLAARMNRRSVFTNTSQDRAYDEIADMLMERCRKSETTKWFAIAHLLPDEAVLAKLTDTQRGYLVGRWYALLLRMSQRLEAVWSKSQFDRLQMVVSRGDDSSTWNAIAGAWNKAREHWVSLTYAISGTAMLNAVCPGKVMRLMAADVVRWHASSGGEIHPDTHAWATLPAPWEVLTGRAKCGLPEIEMACRKTKAKYESWSFRRDRKAVSFVATPDLVHGVAVASPELAAALRKAGVFSGKEVSGQVPEFEVVRDQHGAATLATLAPSGSSR